MMLPDCIPRRVMFRGKPARVLAYENGKFEILDHRDMRRLVSRDHIVFIGD